MQPPSSAGLLAAAALVVMLVTASSTGRRFQHFEDYLNSLDEKEQAWLTSRTALEEELEGSGGDGAPARRLLPLRSGFSKSKDVTCCMLGTMAGDKGYHCYAKFYRARILLRNRNRAHNRKMGFHGPGRIVQYGNKLMRTFEQCVARRAFVFHKCCHLAAMESKPLRFAYPHISPSA